MAEGISQIGWHHLAEAPVNVVGQVWCPEMEGRADAIGIVRETAGGDRFIDSAWHGYEFTYWHPLAMPPRREHTLERALWLADACMTYPEGDDGEVINRLIAGVLFEGVWSKANYSEARVLARRNHTYLPRAQ